MALMALFLLGCHVQMILERNYDPVIVFSFSKKECEKLALSMVTLDLTDKDEKVLVHSIFTRWV